MRNHLLHILVLLSLLALPACKERVTVEENDGKSPIEMTIFGIAERNAEVTRAVTDPVADMRAFSANTRLFFIVKAEDAVNSGPVLYGYNYGTASGVSSPTAGSKSSVGHPDDNWLYWDDAYARNTKVSIYSMGAADYMREKSDLGKHYTQADKETSETIAKVGTDTYSKVIAFAQNTNSYTDDELYRTGWAVKPVDQNIYWPGSGAAGISYQDKNSFEQGDLVYSNNVAWHSDSDDRRLKFHTESGEKYHKFDKGELIYYHALTMITVKIKCGDGFTGTEAANDFKFTNCPAGRDNSFSINGFCGKGDFDIKTGTWNSHEKSPLPVNYTSICLQSTNKQKVEPYYVLKAFVLPGTSMTTGEVLNMFSFEIEGNQYDISKAKLLTALTNNTGSLDISTILDDGKLKAGYNYEFTFTVGKSKIDVLSAQLAEWEVVTAEEQPVKPNAIEVTTATVGDHYTHANPFDLYRLSYVSTASAIDLSIKNYDWVGRYTDKATLSDPENDNVWTTNWYFESNKHFYHFRAVMPQNKTVGTGTDPDDDYLTLASASKTTTPAASYEDVVWGAPFLAPTGAGSKYSYDLTTNGFDGTSAPTTHQIHHGIVTTNSTIHLLLFHMMSEVTFTIKTTTDADKVILKDGDTNTRVELIGYYKDGKVLMGNGLVETTGTATTTDAAAEITINSHTDAAAGTPEQSTFVYGAVPQMLTNVVLRITTPDNNRYEVPLMNKAKATYTNYHIADPYTANEGKINAWYPGLKYNYSFTLKKTGIEKIEATILDWETVTVDDEDVTIQ